MSAARSGIGRHARQARDGCPPAPGHDPARAWRPAAPRPPASPSATAAPSVGDGRRVGAEGAVADHIAGARHAQVEHRRAGQRDARTPRNPARSAPRSETPPAARPPDRPSYRAPITAAGGCARQCGGRSRRDAAALLIDRDHGARRQQRRRSARQRSRVAPARRHCGRTGSPRPAASPATAPPLRRAASARRGRRSRPSATRP